MARRLKRSGGGGANAVSPRPGPVAGLHPANLQPRGRKGRKPHQDDELHAYGGPAPGRPDRKVRQGR